MPLQQWRHKLSRMGSNQSAIHNCSLHSHCLCQGSDFHILSQSGNNQISIYHLSNIPMSPEPTCFFTHNVVRDCNTSLNPGSHLLNFVARDSLMSSSGSFSTGNPNLVWALPEQIYSYYLVTNDGISIRKNIFIFLSFDYLFYEQKTEFINILNFL